MNKLLLIGALCGAVAISGCSWLQDNKDKIHQEIIEYVENNGQEAAIKYIDKLVEEGKLGKYYADKLKEAIPQGVDKMKEVMNGEEDAE